jgi:hypothetical protein
MRLGALAFARVTHFGIPGANAEFMLKNIGDRAAWAVVRDEKPDASAGIERLTQHFLILLGE